jgi:hypothetical protein
MSSQNNRLQEPILFHQRRDRCVRHGRFGIRGKWRGKKVFLHKGSLATKGE